MPDKQAKRFYNSYFTATTFLIAVVTITLLAPIAAYWRHLNLLATDTALASGLKSYRVSSPLQLSWQPSLILERGLVVVDGTGSSNSGQPANNGTNHLRNLVLQNARFTLVTNSSQKKAKQQRGDEPREIVAPLLAALSKFGFDTLDISHSKLVIKNADGGTSSQISDITARFIRSSSGLQKANGSFVFRAKRVNFSASLDLSGTNSKNTLVPFSFELQNKLLTSTFTGRLSLANGSQLQGNMNLSIADLRVFSKWLIGDFPSGLGLKRFYASGPVNMIGKTLSFENANFELDGNKSTGGLTLNLEQKRPLFVGTLAADSINLAPYLSSSPRSRAALASSQTTLGASNSVPNNSIDLSMPVFRYFDADVRFSAKSIQLGTVTTGNAAIAMSLRGGKLLADIAEIELEGGRGIGQITVDMSNQIPHFAIRSKLDDVDISRFIATVIGGSALQGSAQLIVKLNGKGENLKQLTSALTGKLNLNMPEGGLIGVNPQAMFSAANKASFTGWSGVRGGTQLQNLNFEFIARNGVFRAMTMKATSEEREISCFGKIDLPGKKVDLRILLKKQPKKNISDVLRIRGNWDAPRIWRDYSRKKVIQMSPPSPSNSG